MFEWSVAEQKDQGSNPPLSKRLTLIRNGYAGKNWTQIWRYVALERPKVVTLSTMGKH